MISQSRFMRFLKSGLAVKTLNLQMAARQQYFLLILVPFILVAIAAPFLSTTSHIASYRLLIKTVFSAGTVILFVGIILAGSTSLQVEARYRSAYRSSLSPGGRISVLAGRLAAFAILAALVALVGIASSFVSLEIFKLRFGASTGLEETTLHHSLTPTRKHLLAGKPLNTEVSGVIWIDEHLPSITWTFPFGSESFNINVHLQVTPVVASAIETKANLIVSEKNGNSRHEIPIKLYDNRPSSIKFPCKLTNSGDLEVTIKRLPESMPFGFDLNKNELGVEKNGVSLVSSERSSYVNIMAAWFIVWIKLCFAASIAVFASTFLSGPIAASFSLIFFLLANILGFLKDFADTIGHVVGCGCGTCGVGLSVKETTFFQKTVKVFLKYFTDWYPDISSFNPTEALTWGQSIPAGFIFSALIYFLIYAAIFWTATAFILKRKEF